MFRARVALMAGLVLAAGCKNKDETAADTGKTGEVAEDIDHCGAYIEARTACVVGFGGNPADYGLDDAGWCEGYDAASDEAFACHTEAWLAAYCETVDGYNAGVSAAEACPAY